MKKLYLIFFVLLFFKYSFGKDSTYVVGEFNFKLISQAPLTKQIPFPYSKNMYGGCPEYGYGEGKDNNKYYFGEIRILDCREKLKWENEAGKKAFFQEYKKYIYSNYSSNPDSSTTYKNLFCMIGLGKFVDKKDEPKQRFKYAIFFYKDCIYHLTAMDTKKNINESFNDLLKRFDFIK